MSNKEPLISVIMGIYNCADTLEESLNSIIQQTYQNFEIIMCNDGSTDETINVAKKFKNMYPDRIVIIENDENKGLNYTLNHCLKYAKGEYIARMDGDDLCDPTRFEKELNFLIAHPEYAIVSTPMKYFDENGVWGTSCAIEKPSAESFKYGTPFCHAPVMVRKEAYEAVGGYTDEKKLIRVEDYNLFMKMYMLGYKGYNLQEPLYSMRDGREAIERRKFKFRINETYAKCLAIKNLKLSKICYLYALRPIIVGLLPLPVYKILHKKRLSLK